MLNRLLKACGNIADNAGKVLGKLSFIHTQRIHKTADARITNDFTASCAHYFAQLSHMNFALLTPGDRPVVHIFHTTNNKNHELGKEN